MPLAQLADPWQKMPVEGTSGEVSPHNTQRVPAPRGSGTAVCLHDAPAGKS